MTIECGNWRYRVPSSELLTRSQSSVKVQSRTRPQLRWNDTLRPWTVSVRGRTMSFSLEHSHLKRRDSSASASHSVDLSVDENNVS